MKFKTIIFLLFVILENSFIYSIKLRNKNHLKIKFKKAYKQDTSTEIK